MTIKRSQTKQRMSQSVVHGNTVYLAGQVAAPRRQPTSTPPLVRPVSVALRPALSRLDHVLSRRGPPAVATH